MTDQTALRSFYKAWDLYLIQITETFLYTVALWKLLVNQTRSNTSVTYEYISLFAASVNKLNRLILKQFPLAINLKWV